MPEERVVDPRTGGEKGRKEEELGFVDPLALKELGKVAGMGTRKYSPFNYLKGYDWSLSMNALQRHLLAMWSGEDVDPESGLLHAAHAMWHAAALTSFQLRGIGNDDRPGNNTPHPAATSLRRDVREVEHDCSRCDCWFELGCSKDHLALRLYSGARGSTSPPICCTRCEKHPWFKATGSSEGYT